MDVKYRRLNAAGLRTSSSKHPRSCLKWLTTVRIFTMVSLRWIHMSTGCVTKINYETPTGRDPDITNPHKCKQTLHVSAGNPYLSAGTSTVSFKKKFRVWIPKGIKSPMLVGQETRM